MNKETMIKYALKSFVNEKQQVVQSSTPEKKTSWWSRKKQQPVSPLTLEEQRILRKVKSRAHFLDRGLSCCCFQVGFDGLVGNRKNSCFVGKRKLISSIGFIPVIGDFIGVLLAIQLVYIAMSLELPNELVSKMMFNIAFDFVVIYNL